MFATYGNPIPSDMPTKLIALVDPDTLTVVGLTTDVEDAPDLGHVVERVEFPLGYAVHIGHPCPTPNI